MPVRPTDNYAWRDAVVSMSIRTWTGSVGSLGGPTDGAYDHTRGKHLPRSGRVAVVAVMVVATLIWPGWGATSEPPDSRTSHHLVDEWSGAHAGGWRTSPVLGVTDLVLVGAGWETDAEVQVRARSADGWSPWQELERHGDHGHDHHGTDEPRPARSEPVWTGRSEALQLRSTGTPSVDVTAVTMSGPDGLAYSPFPAGSGSAQASADRVVPRSAWDPAGECRPNTEPEYAPEVDVGVVHHTHIFPHYTPEEADDLIRAICLYHVGDRGFDDVAYNLLIDQYGVVYEGRAGGVDEPVVGAHSAGFNESSFGVAVVGDFQEHDVPQPAVDALDRVLAWKFSLHGIDPHATHQVVSTGGDTPGLTSFAEGATVELPSIIGHRDTSSDSLCPGRHLYARLNGASDRVAALMAAGVSMEVPVETPRTEEASASADPVADEPPHGPPEDTVGLMAAPAAVPDLPVTGSVPTSLLGAAALGVAGLAVAGRRR